LRDTPIPLGDLGDRDTTGQHLHDAVIGLLHNAQL
jgi:hypothetical protein